MTSSPSSHSPKPWWSTKNTFVAAIGGLKKPKRQLTIKPVNDNNTNHISTTLYTNRPPSKSVSSTIDDSLGPSTPSDTAPRSRQSLFTLSDDPFAARVITDPTRLSAYSDKPSDRLSYASSDYQRSHKLSLRSKSSFEVDIPPVMTPSASNVTLTDTRPRIRARGMTDCPPPSRPLLSEEVPKLHPRPNPTRLRSPPGPPNPPPPFSPPMPSVVIRQASINRSLPPSVAPPALALPTIPPPVTPEESSPTLSESSISFASSESNSDPYRPKPIRRRPYRTKEEQIQAEKALSDKRRGHQDVYEPPLLRSSPPLPPPRLPSSPLQVPQQRTLKKASSHQSMTKGSISKSPFSSQSPPPMPPVEQRSPRKQRSFHHPKVPPISSFPSFTSPESAPSSPPGSVRRRLFSGGSKRLCTPDDDDDVPSVFSLAPEHDISSSGPPISIFPSSTFSPKSITSSLPPHEYLPQQIMSPAEMLRVEASVLDAQPDDYSRPRGLSITSTSTTGSWWDREREQQKEDSARRNARSTATTPTSTISATNGRRATEGLSRSTSASISVMHRTHSTPSPASSRPSTSSGIPDVTSLPPPPRRRPGTGSGPSSKPPSVRSSHAPSVHSLETSSSHATVLPRATLPSASAAASSTAPPPSWKKRQSLMRKPSFLDIEDDDAMRSPPPAPKKFDPRVSTAFGVHEDDLSSSFLNLRDSLDTVRGSDE